MRAGLCLGIHDCLLCSVCQLVRSNSGSDGRRRCCMPVFLASGVPSTSAAVGAGALAEARGFELAGDAARFASVSSVSMAIRRRGVFGLALAQAPRACLRIGERRRRRRRSATPTPVFSRRTDSAACAMRRPRSSSARRCAALGARVDFSCAISRANVGARLADRVAVGFHHGDCLGGLGGEVLAARRRAPRPRAPPGRRCGSASSPGACPPLRPARWRARARAWRVRWRPRHRGSAGRGSAGRCGPRIPPRPPECRAADKVTIVLNIGSSVAMNSVHLISSTELEQRSRKI